MITGFLVTDHSNDMGLIHDTAVEAKQIMGVQAICVTADKGYESRADMEACVLDGIMPDVGFRYDHEERVMNLDYLPTEITDEMRAAEHAEDITACLHAGVLPDCYANTKLLYSAYGRLRDLPDGQDPCISGKQEKRYGIRQ
jgi:transposase